MDEVQAYFLKKKLLNLDRDNLKREQIAKTYEKTLENSEIDYIKQGNGSVFHLFVALPRSRKNFQSHMELGGVKTLIHYPETPMKSSVYSKSNSPEIYPMAKMLSERVVSIPLWPSMTKKQVVHVCRVLADYKDI